MIIYAYVSGDDKHYRGFHQNLYGPECMCTVCIHIRCNTPMTHGLPLTARSIWVQIRCPVCGSLSCESVHDHGCKCTRGDSE